MAQVLKVGLFDIQVCVPKDWTDKQVVEYAETEAPCGTTKGWGIRKQGNELLFGCDERVQCDQLIDFCHIVLDA